MKIKILIFSLFALFFLGCANKINMGYYSTIEKNYIFNANAPIVVAYDKNDLLSAYYINLIVYELQKQGFNSVYKQEDLPIHKAKNVVFVKLFHSVRPYPSINYSYSMFSDGLMQSCYWYGEQFYCNDKPNKTYVLSGYSESLNYLSGYHFTLDWYDLNLKRRILYINGSVNGKTCGYNLLLRDLVIQTISRIDLKRAENYRYYFDLPYYWVCP
ncbi:hypothetical protein [Helicobacter sp. 13S00477-4]|uniref:hypothetical protein n=1 Tax=Helicobacter sp. 13S00477-4 TaxID=1905759 RepID=UPI000BA60328|nr:hypothetical protein [Helicobacter sp. 13S00477-4]PAF50565.1 hypothetical protein BKH44_07695 [Helicobacter sp. 13S00477-4]